MALGLGGVAGAEADKGRRRSRERRRRSRTRSRRRGSTPSSDSGGYYVPKSNRSRGPPANGGGHYDDRTPDRYKPAGYIRGRDDRDSERGNDRGQEVARRNNQSFVGARSNGAIDEPRGKKRDSSSSESSSEVCSSSEDDRRTKKMKGKEFLTAGLAAVATIHAAHGVYSSMEARDQRQMEVLKGELSPEEARKTKHKAWLQDAAAIGIAALGIKGAYSEWQEVQGHRHELAEEQSERKKRHEKRVRKAEKYQKGGSQYGRSRSEGPGRRDRDYSR